MSEHVAGPAGGNTAGGQEGVVVPPGSGPAAAVARSRPSDQVSEPAKVMRLGTMLKQLLDEVREAPLDEAARQRLVDVHARSIAELKEGLSEDLAEELDRVMLPFGEETPSDAELRVAQAQLVGWLEGLFHGIQTAIVAQQMAAQSQLQQMRQALPGGVAPGGPVPGVLRGPAASSDDDHPTGQYL